MLEADFFLFLYVETKKGKQKRYLLLQLVSQRYKQIPF